MKKPKIIFLSVNIDKEIKNINKKKAKQAIKSMKSDLYRLINSNDKVFANTMEKIDLYTNNIDDKSVNNLYKEYLKGFDEAYEKDITNVKAIPMEFKGDNISSSRQEHIKTSILNIFNKADKFLNKKSTKVVMGFAVVLFFIILGVILHVENNMTVMTLASMSEIPAKINTMYSYAKTLGFIVAFVFLTVELIQSGLKGDTRAMAMIFAKYLMFAVALLSFKAIYDMIDKFFN